MNHRQSVSTADQRPRDLGRPASVVGQGAGHRIRTPGNLSTRGTNFLDWWITNNVPKTGVIDVISIAELAQQLFADAKAVGISSAEIEEDTESAYEAILDAIVHHDAGLAD